MFDKIVNIFHYYGTKKTKTKTVSIQDGDINAHIVKLMM